jgi:arylsulfatase A-like enzyme
MRAVMLMFDSLNKKFLSAYGNEETITPNFKRLKENSLCFENFFVGSLPCMPARRELHTGRYNFLHRGWGPIEPFDNSMPEILKNNKIYTHIITDHKHYWRDGGATYHTRYNSYEFIRGQEGDNWIGEVKRPEVNYESGEREEEKNRKILSRTQDIINRKHMPNIEDHFLHRTVMGGIDFIERNKNEDKWFLQIECFDPHEPYFVPKKYLDIYGVGDIDFDGWPKYYILTEDEEKKEIIRKYYMALVTMCDDYLGKVLDKFDEYNLWKDTMLIVNTDHGFLLGEHEWWGKNIMPVYNEIANTPFFIWDPRFKRKNCTTKLLAQTIDIPATLLEFFLIEKPVEMLGKTMRPILEKDNSIRETAIFGYLGSHVNITDGKYVYMRAPLENNYENLFEYTLMPTRINRRFTPKELQGIELVEPFSFTKNCKLLKVPVSSVMTNNATRYGNKLFNIINDPCQKKEIIDVEKEIELLEKIKIHLLENEAPQELYKRIGLDDGISKEKLLEEKKSYQHIKNILLENLKTFDRKVDEGLMVLFNESNDLFKLKIELENNFRNKLIVKEDLFNWVNSYYSGVRLNEILYKVKLNMRLD